MSTPAWSSGRELRISDAEREASVHALGEHFAAGRLTRDEYDERAERAFGARTAAEVRPLFADLPAPHPPVLGGAARAPAPPVTSGSSRNPPAARPSGPAYLSGSRPGPRLPWLPLLLVVVGLAVLVGAPWLVFVALGLLWCSRSSRRHGCGPAAARPPH